jgi:hypothetical protein
LYTDLTSTISLLRRFPDGTVKKDQIDTIAAGWHLTPQLLPLPGGGAQYAEYARHEWQNQSTDKCQLDTGVAVDSIAADGTVGTGTVAFQDTATQPTGGNPCTAQQLDYSDAGGKEVFPPVMAISPKGETSLVTGEAAFQGLNVSPTGGLVDVVVAPGHPWTDATAELVFGGIEQAEGVAYAGEDPVVALPQAQGGVLATQRINGKWTSPTLIDGRVGDAASIIGSADGSALIATWPLAPGGKAPQSGQIHAYIRDPSGQIDTGTLITNDETFDDVWADGQGDFGVVNDGDADPGPAFVPVTATVVYDGAPPKVTVSGPASATAGQPADGFTATASDIWSTVGTPAWTFGDGGTASGSPVSHVFAAAGHQTVSATVTDAAGNSATGTTALDTKPPPTPPPVKDTTKPTVTKLKVSFSKKTREATFRFTLSEDATVKLSIKRKGVKKATTITKKLKQGRRSIATKKLKLKVPYTFTLAATDAAKNTSKLSSLKRTFR